MTKDKQPIDRIQLLLISKFVGGNIRTHRRDRGWNQECVANKLGISIPALSKIESGSTDINLSRLEQIANIYEIAVTDLFSTDEVVQIPSPSPLKFTKLENSLKDSTEHIMLLQQRLIMLYEELEEKRADKYV